MKSGQCIFQILQLCSPHLLPPPTIFRLLDSNRLGDALLVALNFLSVLPNTSRSSNNLYEGTKGFCPVLTAEDLALELTRVSPCVDSCRKGTGFSENVGLEVGYVYSGLDTEV